MSPIVEVHIEDPAAPSPNRVLRFSKSPIRIGRNQLNDISLQDPFVSEWHGIIRFDERSVAYFDLGSTNGSILDRQRLAKNVPAALTPASKLQLGMLTLKVAPARDDGAPLKTLGWGPSTPPPSAGIRGPALAAPVPGTSSEGRNLTRLGLSDSAPTPPPPARPAVPAVAPRRASGPLVVLGPDAPPAAAVPASASAASAPDARTAILLEAFSEAFVGLRKGYEQFGSEVGIRIVNGTTPLHRARTSREVMDYFLAPGVDPSVAARELIQIFADFAIHHIAMMEGITEGARSLLQTLDPRANQVETGPRLLASSKSKQLWSSYLERFEQILNEDEQLHAALFGDDFARAYASVALGEEEQPAHKGKR
jgi:type VI secretion system protein ImpI